MGVLLQNKKPAKSGKKPARGGQWGGGKKASKGIAMNKKSSKGGGMWSGKKTK